WLIREQAHPDLPATLDEASHGHAAGLDLTVSDVAAFHDFQSIVTERQLRPAPRLAAHAAALLLAVLNFLWHQHKIVFPLLSANLCFFFQACNVACFYFQHSTLIRLSATSLNAEC